MVCYAIYRYKESDVRLVCEKCRRPLGPEVLTCDYRDVGACPYVVERRRGLESTWASLLLVFFGLLFGGMPLSMVRDQIGDGIGASDVLSLLFVSLFVLFGLVAVFGGVIGLFGAQLTVRNTETGQRWQRNSFFGILLYETTVTALQPVPFSFASAPSLTYPASVVALYYRHDAAEILYLTLLDLLAHHTVRLYVAQSTTRFPKRRPSTEQVLVLSPGASAQQAHSAGLLEQRIERIAQEWSVRRDLTIRLPRYSRGRGFPDLFTIADLVPLLFKAGRFDPVQWLVNEIVGVDASQRGLGPLDKWHWRDRFTPVTAALVEHIRPDYLSLCQMEDAFRVAQPEAARVVRQAIKDAIVDVSTLSD